MMRKLYVCFASVLLLASCEKEDDALTLPEPGPVTRVIADIGTDYTKAVYISLKHNTQQTRLWKDWDLAFEATDSGTYVWLNTGKFMFAAHTNVIDFTAADTLGKEWKMDDDALTNDSNAIGKWWMNDEVMIIDRGKVFYTGINAGQRFKKIRFEQVSANQYVFSYCNYNNSTPVSYTLNKISGNGLMYFSFDNGGQIVDMAPANENWDFVLTRYTHIYYEEPLSSPYRYYLVNGGISNKWNGITGLRMIKDSTAGYVPFEEMNRDLAEPLAFLSEANTIGFEWKAVDINTSSYTIIPNRYYLLKDKEGFVYKVRFLNFYDDQGRRGVITFEYQRL